MAEQLAPSKYSECLTTSGSAYLYFFRYTDIDQSKIPSYAESLSEEEQQRAATKTGTKYQQFIFERYCLRNSLSKHLSRAPSEIELEVSDKGKPRLSQTADSEQQIHFSLSHSKEAIVIAICKECEVGVDLESIDRSNNFATIAKYYFSEEEQKLVSEGQDASSFEFKRNFVQLWTAKEALGKLVGTGINKSVLRNSTQILEQELCVNSDWLGCPARITSLRRGNLILSLATLSLVTKGNESMQLVIIDPQARETQEITECKDKNKEIEAPWQELSPRLA